MVATAVYDGRVSGGLIVAAVTVVANTRVIPYANGQRVVIIEDI